MWRINRDKHCTDEELLGHLDGEISRRHTAEVERHLRNCWECRARSARLNEQSQALARMFVSSYLEPDDLTRGKARLRLRQNAVDRELADRTPHHGALLLWAALGSAAAAILCCAIWWPRPLPAPALAARIDASATLRRAGQQERAAWNHRGVHQVYSVELLQEIPKLRREVRRLEIWEAPGGRYSSTLSDPNGHLRFGLWIPNRGVGYETERGTQAVAISVRDVHAGTGSAADSIASGSGDLEETLKAWLKQRHWQRLALASDFQAFASEDAVVLAVQPIGAGRLRLTARRLTSGVRLTATLELDDAGRPWFHSIRVETAGRVAELRLREERSEALAPEDLNARVFEPNVPVAPDPGFSEDRPLAATAAPRNLSGERELEAYYALHRAGACLKETLEVHSESGERIALRLLVADRAREMEVRGALARDASAEYWDVDIQIGRPKSRARTGPASAPPGREVSRKWDDVWAEGLALVDLASHFGPEVRAGFTPEARMLLNSMLREHAAALNARLGGIRAALPATTPVPALAHEPGPVAGDWRDACFKLFQAIDQADRLIEDGSARQFGIPQRELPTLHASLAEVEYLAGLVMQTGDTPRMSVSGVRLTGDASSPRPRPGKGAPK